MFIIAMKNMKLAKFLILNKLKNHKNTQNQESNTRMSKIKKYLNWLINSQKGKVTSAMIKLHQNNDYFRDKETDKFSKFSKVLLIANNKYKTKQNNVVETLRNRNRLVKDLAAQNAKRMRGAYHSKMKQALEKLRENKRKGDLMDKVKKQLFENIMAQKYRDSVKNCLDALRKHKDNQLRDEDIKRKLKNALFDSWARLSKDNLKKYLDQMRDFKN